MDAPYRFDGIGTRHNDADAQGLIEYALIAALIAVALVAVMAMMGSVLTDSYKATSDAVNSGQTVAPATLSS